MCPWVWEGATRRIFFRSRLVDKGDRRELLVIVFVGKFYGFCRERILAERETRDDGYETLVLDESHTKIHVT